MPRNPALKVAIIGAGVIGLSIGWILAEEGFDITIFDAKKAGRQTSWAAAGLLTPYSEEINVNERLFKMQKASLALYPNFLKSLQIATNMPLSDEPQGTLYVAMDEQDRPWLQQHYAIRQKQGAQVYSFSRKEALKKEPLISPDITGALWMPEERQINGPLLIQALLTAIRQRGAIIEEGQQANKVLVTEKGIHLTFQNGREHLADVCINTCGSWSSRLFKQPEIFPIKGQLIQLNTHLLAPSHIIRSRHVYIAPKKDGSARLGATSEDKGFDTSISAGGMLELLKRGYQILPALTEWTFEQCLCGLRPFSSHHLPTIQQANRRLIHAVGHGRSGFLLAPYTAYHVRNIIKDIYAAFF
jgi:glycine oxidase